MTWDFLLPLNVILTSQVFVQSTEEPRSSIKDITVQIIDLVSKRNGNSTIIKAIIDVHPMTSPKTGKPLRLDLTWVDCLKFSKNSLC